MTVVYRLLSATVLLLVTFAAALPWGIAQDFRLLLPLLPLVVVHVAIVRGGGIDDWLVFVAGLVTDVLGQGPLGYWALMYLVAFALLRSTTRAETSTAMAVAVFAAMVALLAALQWAMASLYYLRLMDLPPLAIAAAGVIVVDLVAMLLSAGPRRRAQVANQRLERGGWEA